VPTTEQVAEAATQFAMADLLAAGTNAPMFVINGDQDAHVPLADTQLFEGRPDTEVQIIPGGTHCAFNKLDQVITANVRWLSTALH
jgi:esterase FrsA